MMWQIWLTVFVVCGTSTAIIGIFGKILKDWMYSSDRWHTLIPIFVILIVMIGIPVSFVGFIISVIWAF